MIAIIDIDDVTLNWTKGFSTFVQKDITNTDARIHACLGITDGEEMRVVEQFNHSPKFAELEFIDGAIAGIAAIRKMYDVFFVTSCGITPFTKLLRAKNLLNVARDGEIIHLPIHHDKDDIINKLQPDLIIDDNMHNVAHAVKMGAKGIVFDAAWTRKRTKTHTWSTILPAIGID